jgi:hypothetical protein
VKALMKIAMMTIAFALAVSILGVQSQNILAATTYYIATNGNNANPGTQALPWAGIGKANSTLQPGDTVIFGDGVYGGTNPIRPKNNGYCRTKRQPDTTRWMSWSSV